MPGTIPGGRQRTASEGDILDYDLDKLPSDFETQLSFDTHTGKERFWPTSVYAKGEHCLTDTDQDSNASRSTLERKSKSQLNPFKAVKKSVVRMVRQAVWSVSSSGVNDKHDGKSRYDIKAIVTPTLRRKVKNSNVYSNNDSYSLNNYKENYQSSEFAHSCDKYKWPGDVTPGTVGLKNHGNTCFMNAVLQCLSNTDLLTEYFVTDKYKEDLMRASAKINSKKYGTNNDLTKHLAIVLQSLWTKRYTSNITENFKNIIGKCNRQYYGSSQHDAQEFLLWLLDKLHEDLCLVLKKKNKPIKNPSPCADDDLALEVLSQNKSFVYDTFQALHRSSLTCPNCKKNSNTYDPYVCVSLPLPQKSFRPVYVTVVVIDTTPKQIKIALSMDPCGTIADLRLRICSDTKIPESQLLIVQYYDDGLRSTYSDDQPLSDIPESETVYAIEMVELTSSSEYSSSLIQIVFVSVERLTNPSRCIPFCSPEVMHIPRDVSFLDLHTHIIQQMGDSIDQSAIIQKDEVLFNIRIVDGASTKGYLLHDVDMPLYTEAVDEALSHVNGNLPAHLKLVVEWDSYHKESVVINDVDAVVEHSSVHRMRLTQNQTTSSSLDECFDLYTREEKLSGDDAWLCPYCKKQQLGTIKKLGLWTLPDIFVVHLKRFRQIGQRRSKLNTLVSFPLSGLDMSRHIAQRNFDNNNRPASKSQESGAPLINRYVNDFGDIYDLYAVCNHYGNMQGGHYTAFCKSSIDRNWYTFDDSNVRVMADNKVVSNAAYILFYQRRSLALKTQMSLESGKHWIYQLSKISFPDLPELNRVNKPLPPSPQKSPSHSSPGYFGRNDPDGKNGGSAYTPSQQQRGRQFGTSTLPRTRREHSAPAPSNRVPLPSNVKTRANTQESPRLRRHSSERRFDQNFIRSSATRSSTELDKSHMKKDNPLEEIKAADSHLASADNRLAENMTVNLPPIKASNHIQKTDETSNNIPKSILKPPSDKFGTLPRSKAATPDKCAKISESKSVHELSWSTQIVAPSSEEFVTDGVPVNKGQASPVIVVKSNNFAARNQREPTNKFVADDRSDGSASPLQPPRKDNTHFEIRHNARTNSLRSSRGDSYASLRNSSGSDTYSSPHSSYTSSPKSSQEEVKSVRISPDMRQSVARTLFAGNQHSHTTLATSGSHRINMPGSAYSIQRPYPRPRPHTNLGGAAHSFWEKPPPAPTPPVFNPFKTKKIKPHKAEDHRFVDSRSLDRYSHLRINTGIYDNAGVHQTYAGRVPNRGSMLDDKSCLKESSV